MEVDRWEEARWQEHIAEAFAASVVFRPFLWYSQGVILLDLKVNNIPAKAVYDPGCAGVAVSWYFVKKFKLKPQQAVPLTLSSANGVTTINRDVLNSLNVK